MSDKPGVLFVCVHDAGRSQMAGGEPGSRGRDAREVGIDTAAARPKVRTTEAVEPATW